MIAFFVKPIVFFSVKFIIVNQISTISISISLAKTFNSFLHTSHGKYSDVLKSIKFSSLTYLEKVEIKNKGRPTPALNIEKTGKSRNKECVRKFYSAIYDKHDWICRCEQNNFLFCFPCLLFGGESEWTMNGISKLKNLQLKIIKHQHSQKHLNNVVSLSFLGKVNIINQLSEGHTVD